MAFKNLRLSYKMMLGLRRYVSGSGGNERRTSGYGKRKKKQSWMMPAVSHGYHVVVEDGNNDNNNNKNSSIFVGESRELGTDDKVVAQREEIEEHELWFFGVFDSRTGDGVSKYMQTHLFDKKKIKETQMRSRSKETMRKAYLNARAKVREAEKADDDESWELGSATAVVIDGEKIVVADMGEYKVVVCRDGKAYQINRRLQHQQPLRRHWSRTFIPGAFRKVKVRFAGRDSGNTRAAKTGKTSEVAVGYERIGSETEFVILASIGIWEVMKHQEAVNLIRHIEDPQEAAECLAREALIRMTRKNISCLIIRFD